MKEWLWFTQSIWTINNFYKNLGVHNNYFIILGVRKAEKLKSTDSLDVMQQKKENL